MSNPAGPEQDPAAWRVAVLGSPVAHSLSPALHTAGYRAAGLMHWYYSAIECDAATLPALVGSSGPQWAGFSVTMPGKGAAAAFATEPSRRVRMLGVANTLSRVTGGWAAENTDVDGVVGALAAAGVGSVGTAVVLGGGHTARAVVAALAERGTTRVVMAGRRPAGTADCVDLARQLGLAAEQIDLSPDTVGRALSGAGLLVSTLPAGAADHLAPVAARVPALLDAVYHPWPTPLAAHGDPGRITVTGLDMLLHQAFAQFEIFTGLPAPAAAMRAGLLAAAGVGLPLPIGERDARPAGGYPTAAPAPA